MSRQSLKAAGARTSSWLIPVPVPRGFEPAGAGIAPCRPPGIPDADFVLAQGFEGVMT